MSEIVLGEALKMRFQLAELARRHRIAEPPIATFLCLRRSSMISSSRISPPLRTAICIA
jgi:hypothetical protein